MIVTRKAICEILSPQNSSSRLSNAVNIFIIVLILMNVAAASLETVAGLGMDYREALKAFELFSVALFTLEYALRFWSAVDNPQIHSRWSFLWSFDSVVDLLALAPLFLAYLFGLDLGVLIALRLVRLLKLIRYFEPLAILGAVMKAEFRAFMAAMFILLILIFVASTGIYFFERLAQPDVFGSIPQSMWWAVVTLTTLGYGDVVPVTIPGRVFSAFITILSIGTVALPAGMLSSRFSEELRKRQITMKNEIEARYSDGELSVDDHAALEDIRIRLCLTEGDMKALISKKRSATGICPTCGRGEQHGK